MHDQRNIPEAPTIEEPLSGIPGGHDPGRTSLRPMSPEAGLGETIRGIGGDIWDALAPAASLGAEELTRAMFSGNAYVFHGDTIPQEMQHNAPAVEAMQRQQEGREIEREM